MQANAAYFCYSFVHIALSIQDHSVLKCIGVIDRVRTVVDVLQFQWEYLQCNSVLPTRHCLSNGVYCRLRKPAVELLVTMSSSDNDLQGTSLPWNNQS